VRLRNALSAVVLVGCQAFAGGESSLEQDSVVLQGSLDFGTQQIGTTSAAHTITISPGPTNQNDTVKAITASCPDFVINAGGLPADVFRVCDVVSKPDETPVTGQTGMTGQMSVTGPTSVTTVTTVTCPTRQIQTYTFDASFRPMVARQVSCVVTVTETDNHTGDTNDRSITLTGTGQPPPYHVDVQPASVAFGDVRRNTDSSRAVVVVTSTGGSPLTVSSVTLSAGFAVQAVPTGSVQLGPNESQSYPVVCHPTGVGAMTGQLVVASNDPVQPTVTVPLTCKGIDSNLDITPSPAVLPTTRVGEPIDATIALHNTGTASMILQSVSLAGTGITLASSPPSGMMLAATASTSVGVHFEASDPGNASAILVATYDGGQIRSTQITARALPTSLAITPDGEVDLGPVCRLQRRTQDFSLVANDLGGFMLAGISDPGAPFTVSGPAMPVKVLGAGASQVRFSVVAMPTEVGVATAPLVLHTDIPRAKDHTLQLSVLGLPPGISATPESIDLGSNPLNTTTLGQEVHLSNCTGAPIGFSNARIEGGDALDFAIVQQPSSAMIASAGRATWLIVLQAHSVGVKQSTFKVDHDGGTASIAIVGEGLGDLGKGRASYYACAAGRPSALWPIAIALIGVVRRRRRRPAASRARV
jgi:hypothetical protein